MSELKIMDKKGKEVGKLPVADDLFADPASDHLVWEVVMHYRNNQRVGTHKVKGRAEVRGGGRKPWRQKGTGRARQGSIRAPHWVGGGVVHGPTPRDHSTGLPRKKRKVALRRVLGDFIRDEQVLVVDDLALATHKTKDLAALLDDLGVPGKTLIVDHAGDRNLLMASRNLPGVTIRRPQDVNAYDLLLHEHVTITKDAMEALKEAIAP